MNITHEYMSLTFVLCILIYTWLDANNYNFNDLLNIKIEQPTQKYRSNKRVLYKETRHKQKPMNKNYDYIYSKIGIPTRFDEQHSDYIWDIPVKYPLYQVRSNLRKNKVMISINISKPLILNVDNLNTSLDSKNGILWAHGSTWEEAIIYLYYSLFNINDEKLMNKSIYILEHNKHFEKKLINDIRLKLTELKSSNFPDYSLSEYNADVGMLQQPPMKPNKHIIQQMLNTQPTLQNNDLTTMQEQQLLDIKDMSSNVPSNIQQNEQQNEQLNEQQNNMTISLENEIDHTENNAVTDENGNSINLDSDWNWLPGMDGVNDNFYNL
jgi:hypothetical protein